MKPDYEKKYKDALKLSRSYYSEDTNTFLDTLFPELRESEDERIRKGIIEIIKAVSGPDCDVYLDEKKQEKYIAWLEKQKEQKDYRKLYEDIAKSEWFKKAYEGKSLGCDDEQKEQKPLPGFENADEGIPGKDFIPVEWVDACNRYGKWKLVRCDEQKPAEWSEKHVADIFEKVGLAKIAREQGNDELTNALQDAMLELSKMRNTEWSEEDEKMLNELITIMDGGKVTSGTYLSEYVAWLKSLRPRWRPSEEDIKMLEHIIGQYETGNKNSKVVGYLPRVEELSFLKNVLSKWKN